jgi:acyl-CoA thioesterase FadM
LKTKSAIEQISNKTFVWKHWIFDVETGEAAAIASAVAVTMDLKKRKSIPIPIEMSEALNKLIF